MAIIHCFSKNHGLFGKYFSEPGILSQYLIGFGIQTPEQVFFPNFLMPWEYSSPLQTFIPNIPVDLEICRSERNVFQIYSCFGKNIIF